MCEMLARKSKMNVDVTKLQDALDYIKTINRCDLIDILWDGNKSSEVAINVTVEYFKFMGLNNVTFAELNEIINT